MRTHICSKDVGGEVQPCDIGRDGSFKFLTELNPRRHVSPTLYIKCFFLTDGFMGSVWNKRLDIQEVPENMKHLDFVSILTPKASV